MVDFAGEIVRKYQYDFLKNRPTTDHSFAFKRILRNNEIDIMNEYMRLMVGCGFLFIFNEFKIRNKVKRACNIPHLKIWLETT